MRSKIEKLLKSWPTQFTASPNVIGITFDDTLSLHENGIEPHLLSIQDLIYTGVKLTQNILIPGGSVMTNLDHKLFWLYSCSLLLDHIPFEPRQVLYADRDVFYLFRTCMSQLFIESRLDQNLMERYCDNRMIASYIFFPLIELMSRAILSEYMSRDGLIKKRFSISGQTYAPREDRSTRGAKPKCSNLKHALMFAVEIIEDNDLKSGLTELIEHLNELTGDDSSGYQFLYDARNAALHQGVSITAIGGFAATICILLGFQINRSCLQKDKGYVDERLARERIQQLDPNSWIQLYARYSRIAPRVTTSP